MSWFPSNVVFRIKANRFSLGSIRDLQVLSSTVQVDLQASLTQETRGVNPGTKQETTSEQIINGTHLYLNLSGKQKDVSVLVSLIHFVLFHKPTWMINWVFKHHIC